MWRHEWEQTQMKHSVFFFSLLRCFEIEMLAAAFVFVFIFVFAILSIQFARVFLLFGFSALAHQNWIFWQAKYCRTIKFAMIRVMISCVCVCACIELCAQQNTAEQQRKTFFFSKRLKYCGWFNDNYWTCALRKRDIHYFVYTHLGDLVCSFSSLFLFILVLLLMLMNILRENAVNCWLHTKYPL